MRQGHEGSNARASVSKGKASLRIMGEVHPRDAKGSRLESGTAGPGVYNRNPKLRTAASPAQEQRSNSTFEKSQAGNSSEAMVIGYDKQHKSITESPSLTGTFRGARDWPD